MRLKRFGMCRGNGKAYIGIGLSPVLPGAQPIASAKTDTGEEVPVLWRPGSVQENRAWQLRGVLIVPLLQVRGLTIEFRADNPASGEKTTGTMSLTMNALKWASRFNYRVRPGLCKGLRGADLTSPVSVELLLCVPDDTETVWRFAVERVAAKGGKAEMAFSVFDETGRPYQSDPIVLRDRAVGSDESLRRALTVSFRLPAALHCFCIAVSDVLDQRTVGLYGVGPGEYAGAAAATAAQMRNANDEADYSHWRRLHEPSPESLQRQAATRFPYEPLISIITPSYKPDLVYLTEMIDSVRAQTYSRWELVLVDSLAQESGVEEVVSSVGDDRIHRIDCEQNRGIAGNTNWGLAHATGDFVAFLDYDDLLAPDALYEYVASINACPQAGLLYCDEDMFEHVGAYRGPSFKSAFNRDLLYSHNYLTHFLMVRKEVLDEVGYSDDAVNGAQDYDIALKVSETGHEILHVPHMLYHWRIHAGSTSGSNSAGKPYAHTAGKVALERHFARRGIEARVEDGKTPYIYRVGYALPEPQPLVDIVIPHSGHPGLLDRCVTAILESSTYDNYRITVVKDDSADRPTEGGSAEDPMAGYYEELQQRSDKVRVLSWPGEPHYARLVNFGINSTQADYVLLLDDDVEAVSSDFIQEMLGYMQRPEVGVVGAKLYFADGLLQHGGMLVGSSEGVVYVNQDLPGSAGGYLNRAERPGNFSSVTGACQLIRRATFDQVGGYSEEFAVSLGDADFCCKAIQAGFLVVFSPYAELIYHGYLGGDREEGSPIEAQQERRERGLMRQKWPCYFSEGDPFSNPHLDRDNRYFALPY